MLIPKLTGRGPRLTERDLEVLEDKLGARLPTPYRSFLLQQNGGYVDSEYSAVEYFYSVRARREFHDLLNARRRMQEWLPAALIPIASESPNEICLAIKGKNRGKVYFWNFEGAPEKIDIRAKYPEIFAGLDTNNEPREPIKEDWPGEPDLTLIADSFPEFLENMHEEAKEFEAEVTRAEAREARAKAKSTKAKPGRAKAKPTRAKAKPTKAKAKPTRDKAKSTRAKAGSRPAKAKPGPAKAKPARARAASARSNAKPAKSKVRSARAKPAGATPGRGKAKPGKPKAIKSRPATPTSARKSK